MRLSHLLVAFLFLGVLSWGASEVTLIQDGVAVADIVHCDDAKFAIKGLNEYLKKACGCALPVVAKPTSRAKVVFSVVPGMDQEAFRVEFPDEGTIAIMSGSPDGLKLAIWDFLERHLGIRWLFPGELGEVVPRCNSVRIASVPYEDSPSFLSRKFSGGLASHRAWQDMLRGSRIRVAFHHNLHKLFSPQEFAESHPEFYPVLYDGKRYIPVPDPKDRKWEQRWQPCFSTPGIAEAAADKIMDVFAKTGVRTYSLGINDTNDHCRCPKCVEVVGSRLNFAGLPNYSSTFVPFANRVAELVSTRYPDCKIGFLAYSCLLEPVDGLALHPNLVPFMTFDRMMWIDPQREANGHTLTQKWKSPELAWSDYIYGRFYALPRVYFHKMAEYLRWGYAHGVRHQYAEYYPSESWHEGPKFYLALKLLWNINTDVDATLDEWYRLAVGPEAAPILKEYYARLEDFWTHRVQETNWFKEGRQYLDFKSSGYLEAYSMEDLLESEALLRSVVEKSSHPARAQFFLDGFLAAKASIVEELGRYARLKAVKRLRLLYSNSYDAEQAMPSGWQRDYSHGRFLFDKAGGRNGSGGIAIDAKGSHGTPMCFLEYQSFGAPSQIKAGIWYKAEDVDETASCGLTLKWMAADSQGALDAKPNWLPDKYTFQKTVHNLKDGEWSHLELTALTPEAFPCKMCLQLVVKNTHGGRVVFDDLQVFAE